MSASGAYGPPGVCSGIVGFADLTLGDKVRPVLERLVMAAGGVAGGGGRFCGIRQPLVWDRDDTLLNPAYATAETLVDQPSFREGFGHLARLGLSFEVWAFFPQLAAVERLARAFPETAIIVNHCGGVVRVNGYANRDDVFETWQRGIASLARCPNVSIKLSGLGMRLSGFGFEAGPRAPASSDLASAWRPWVLHCLESFGAHRCMWGSNFPVDKGSYSLKIGLNALKRLLSGATAEEKNDVFANCAMRLYRLPSDLVEKHK
jgi:predicted TIM-barrel fold metal-dependent hydrolase